MTRRLFVFMVVFGDIEVLHAGTVTSLHPFIHPSKMQTSNNEIQIKQWSRMLFTITILSYQTVFGSNPRVFLCRLGCMDSLHGKRKKCTINSKWKLLYGGGGDCTDYILAYTVNKLPHFLPTHFSRQKKTFHAFEQRTEPNLKEYSAAFFIFN